MKKLLFFLLLFNASYSLAQNGWQVVYTGDYIYSPYYYDISFPADQTGWVLCRDHVKRTTDGGYNWKRIYFTGTNNYLSNSFFLNELAAWVIVNGKLKYTSDGGETWQNKDTLTGNPKSIYFYNISTGWQCGSIGMIKKTVNGGLNWDSVYSGTTDNLNSISFGSELNGICGGDWGTIISTTNGGLNWIKYTDALLGFYTKVKFTDHQTAFVCGTGGRIFKTTNAGINWSSYPIDNTYLTSVLFSGSQIGYAFSNYYEIYKSTNAGLGWNLLQTSGINNRIFRSAISPGNNMWIAADSGIILKSNNQGTVWNEVFRDYLTKENLNSVHFNNLTTGIITGNHGVILRSVNAGVNWSLVTLNPGLNYTDVQFTDNSTAFICGGNGTTTGMVLKSQDAGVSWQAVYQNDSAHFYSVYFLNSQSGWVSGRNGYILKTTNSGINWVRYKPDNSAGSKIFFINENTGFIAKATLLKSTNGGLNWFNSLSNQAADIQFLGQTGFMTQQNGFIYKTTDEGLTWNSYYTGGTSAGTFYFVNVNTGWVCSGGNIRKTTNGGVNWQLQTATALPLTISSVYFSNESFGYACGGYGGIIRTTNGGIGINQLSSEIPQEFKLYSSYPNPFNPVTRIKFDIPLLRGVAEGRGVLLKIYDILGKEIASLVNEELKPGTYEIQWDASGYPSGVYFYSLIFNKAVHTGKMVLVK